jgi:hypothetical protein
MPFLQLGGGQDQGNVDLDDRPGGIQHDELTGGAAGHRRVELAGGHDVQLLQDLGAEHAGPVAPQRLEQRPRDRLVGGLERSWA